MPQEFVRDHRGIRAKCLTCGRTLRTIWWMDPEDPKNYNPMHCLNKRGCEHGKHTPDMANRYQIGRDHRVM